MPTEKQPYRHLVRAISNTDTMPEPPAGIILTAFDPARDGAAVHGLLAPTYEEFDDGYDLLPFAEWLPELLADAEYSSEGTFLVRSDGGEAVGVIINWSNGFIYDLAVASTWRKRGIGEYLLRRTFAHFAAKGAKKIELKVVCGNPTGAERLYERMGFADLVTPEAGPGSA